MNKRGLYVLTAVLAALVMGQASQPSQPTSDDTLTKIIPHLAAGIEIEDDPAIGAVWYRTSTNRHQTLRIQFALVISQENTVRPRIRVHYVAADWLFADEITVMAGGARLALKLSFPPDRRVGDDARISEIVIAHLTDAQFEVIASAEGLFVNITGGSRRASRELQENERAAIRALWNCYKTMLRARRDGADLYRDASTGAIEVLRGRAKAKRRARNRARADARWLEKRKEQLEIAREQAPKLSASIRRTGAPTGVAGSWYKVMLRNDHDHGATNVKIKVFGKHKGKAVNKTITLNARKSAAQWAFKWIDVRRPKCKIVSINGFRVKDLESMETERLLDIERRARGSRRVQRDCARCKGSRIIRCSTCFGRGALSCQRCAGKGKVRKAKRLKSGLTEFEKKTCELCRGRGGNTCKRCDGEKTEVCPDC